MRPNLLIVGALLAGCAPSGGPPARPPDATAAPPVAPAPWSIAWPDPFERDMAASETVALGPIYKGLGKGACAALRANDPVALRALLTDDFAGRLVGAPNEPSPTPGEAVQVRAWPAASDALDADAFVRATLALTEDFSSLERCKFKPFRFKMSPTHDRAVADLHVVLAGPRTDGAPAARRGTWTLEAVPAANGAWRARRVESSALEEVVGLAPRFGDVAAEVGLVMPTASLSNENVQGHIDTRTRESIGGLAVVDWDRDDRDDLLVWHRGRSLTLFRNDGRGGFERRADLIPPAAVGYHLLVVDLDGDGREEVVSTAILGCDDGVARFALFTRKGDALVPVPGGLPFPRACDDFRTGDLGAADPVVFQHLVAQDVDRDGDLDLYACGYQNRGSRRERFNLYDAQDGEPDRLLINQGHLRFADETDARGLTGSRWSYVATFFDEDDDGDDDLYVANDYGPNSLYLNDGAGRFALAPPSPLTANSESMGLTVADLDEDGDLDLYVSNMYSTAGNRIVPLAEGVLDPETYRTLLASAAGNWLFRRDGPGAYTEVAAETGVAEAGWAWGQAAVDLDDDGDRDLYVVNGMTSNSSDKEHDY